MAVENNAAFKARILSDCGLSTNNRGELSDDDITQYFTDCINDLNEHLRNYVYRTFDTVADQQNYTPASTVRRIIKVWRHAPVSDILISGASSNLDLGGIEYSVIGSLQGQDGISFFNYPSLFEIWAQKLKYWERIGQQDWEYVGGILKLIPPPSSTGDKVLYVSQENFDYSAIPSTWAYIIRFYVRAQSLRKLANQRWNAGGVHASGGFTNYGPQSNLIAQAKDLEEKYEKERGILEMKYYTVI